MNTIEQLVEALKATQPTRQHHQTLEDFGVIFQKHHAAIAAGEQELRREPFGYWFNGERRFAHIEEVKKYFDAEEAKQMLTPLYTREETK